MKIAAFVPMKLNNERLPGKNTKTFSDGQPLYRSILGSLAAVPTVDDIYVFCSDPSIAAELPDGVRFLRRSESLDQSTTKINEVMLAFAQSVVADIYVLAHATAPFLAAASIERMVAAVRSGDYDSALSVVKLQEFLWREGRPFNYDTSSIPRTQDLEPLFVETTGAYVYTRDLLIEEGRRVGHSPALIEVSKIEAIDINEAIDFAIADLVHCRTR